MTTEERSAARLPASVARLAAARGLGAHQVTRKHDNPFATFLSTLVIAGALFGVAALCAWLAEKTEVRAIAIGALLAVLAAMFCVGLGFFELFRGFRVTYLFEHGLVWARNGRADAAAWADLDRLVVADTTDKRPTVAKVTTLDGRHVPIALRWTDDADPVHARLLDVFRATGAQVQNHEPAARPGPETGLSDRALTRIAAIVGIVGGIALSFGLDEYGGLDLGVALTAGFLTVALLIAVAGLLVDQRFIPAAQIYLGLVGLIVLIAANHVFEGHYIVVTGAALAAEAAVVALGIGVYRRLPAPRRLGGRRRLAARRGWRFMPEATVPVGGPETAARLIGVPARASVAMGEGTVTAVAHGLTCVAFDRARRRPRLADEVHTVWTVFLPAPLPYVTGVDVHRARHGDVRPDARPVPPVAYALAGVPSPPNGAWWAEGAHLYWMHDSPARPQLVADRIEQLARYAAQIPWQHIPRQA